MKTCSTSDLNGWQAVTLANRAVELTVVPAKGGDIYSIVDRETGVDVLAKTPAGLRSPEGGDGQAAGEEPIEFLRNYEGGWQTLFPSAGDACAYRGRHIPFHGEVALRPWQLVSNSEPDSIHLQVDCETVPLSLKRVITLADETAEIRIEDTVVNHADQDCDFVLGHHCVFGAPLVQPVATVNVDAGRVVTNDEYWDDTARIRAGQRAQWPVVAGRNGGSVDLTVIEGPELESQDDAYVTDLRAGSASISNPELGLRVSLEWDPRIFGWVVLWQLFGAEKSGSLADAYLLGLEPWTSRHSLERAVAEGAALSVAPRDVFTAVMTVRLERY